MSCEALVLTLYTSLSLALLLYGLNCYVMLALFLRGRVRRSESDATPTRWPVVTVQLPVYNERLVVEGLLAAVGDLDYPRDRLEVQVLDDSTDDTTEILEDMVDRLRARGIEISLIHRDNRGGYKAGALAQGLSAARGEFLAIFDADFLPPRDFLRRTLPPFVDPQIGAVQTRWGHRNEEYSLLTRLQAIGVDAHFTVEQGARAWNDLFMNFNGTGGVWRRTAVENSGGWSAATLTEDLDLSYRAQLRGWRIAFFDDVVVPGELPAEVEALKSQQFRWAKGSIQTAVRLLPAVFRSRRPLFARLQAFLHLSHYLVHPLILACCILAVPAIHWASWRLPAVAWDLIALVILASSLAPSALYAFSQRMLHSDWRRRLLRLPMLFGLGVSLSVNNTRAVLEALLGRGGEFVRTPKLAISRRGGPRPSGGYFTRLSPWVVVEAAVGVYCLGGAWIYQLHGHLLTCGILGAYGASFLGLVALSLSQATAQRRVMRENAVAPVLAEVTR